MREGEEGMVGDIGDLSRAALASQKKWARRGGLAGSVRF